MTGKYSHIKHDLIPKPDTDGKAKNHSSLSKKDTYM